MEPGINGKHNFSVVVSLIYKKGAEKYKRKYDDPWEDTPEAKKRKLVTKQLREQAGPMMDVSFYGVTNAEALAAAEKAISQTVIEEAAKKRLSYGL